MANPITPRIGRLSRTYVAKESTPGVDPGSPTGLIMQNRDKWTFVAKQGTTAAPAYKGNLRPDDRTYDAFAATGNGPMYLDYDTAPYLFFAPIGLGGSGYSKIPLAGGYYLHRGVLLSGLMTPTTLQVQYEQLQTTAAFNRLRNSLVQTLKVGYPMKGAIPLDATLVGSGDRVYTDLGGTKTDNPLSVSNVFNGTAKVNGSRLGSVKDFTYTLNTGATVEDIGMNAGIGIPIPDAINAMVTMKLLQGVGGSTPEGDNNLSLLADAQTPIAVDCLWANLPILTATRWLRILQPNNVISNMGDSSGGKGGKIVEAQLDMVDRAAKIAGEAFGTTIGPYAIVLTTGDAFSVKIDGAAAVTVTLTAGVARTTDQIVTDLNAAGAFSAIAVADNYNGRVRVTSKAIGVLGAASSVQYFAATSASALAVGTALGFVDGVVTTAPVIPGYDSPWLCEFLNKISASY
jgi:hypothetical protein